MRNDYQVLNDYQAHCIADLLDQMPKSYIHGQYHPARMITTGGGRLPVKIAIKAARGKRYLHILKTCDLVIKNQDGEEISRDINGTFRRFRVDIVTMTITEL